MSAILFSLFNQKTQKNTNNFVILNITILIFNHINNNILITNCDYWNMDDKL